MDNAQKLALATRIFELHPMHTRQLPPDLPPHVREHMEGKMARTQKLMAEIYAEHFTEAQLQELLDRQTGEMGRSIAETMKVVQEEIRNRQAELFDSGKDDKGEGTHNTGLRLVMSQGGNETSTAQPGPFNRLVTRQHAPESANLDLIRRYLSAVEAGATGKDLSRFFTPDAVQIEFPNKLNPQGGRSDLATLLRRAEQGKNLMSKQRYEVLSMIAMASKVAAEVQWTGTLAIPMGAMPAGTDLRAHIGMFFEIEIEAEAGAGIESGRIRLQRNYDCVEA